MLSVALICRNEEANLPRWLAAVGPVADQIVAVDSGSTDRTRELLRAAGALVEQRAWTGYADQRNHAASLCAGPWILFLDGDEFLDPELSQALVAFKAAPPSAPLAHAINRKVYFFGRWLRHGGFYPEYVTRLYQKGSASWPAREVHESLEVPGPVGRLPGHVEHHSYENVGQYLRRADDYSLKAAREMHRQGKSAGPWAPFAHGAWNFVYRYVLRAGFLDGYQGYLAARLESLYTCMKYARLRELNAKQPPAE